ncbi:hypothetical protein C0J52_06568 [Blattella germanica]|nr:hypothetical protein C0J52_06568 [Blattella germanica]
MPRKYERNPKAPPRRQWTLENLREAINRLKAGEIGLREASRYYGIPTHTLKKQCDKNDTEEKAVKSMEGAEENLANIQELLKNAVFLRQQIKYEEARRNKKDSSASVYKRLSAHITLDLPDLPELSDALRETASRVESMMRHSTGGELQRSHTMHQ